MNLSLNLTTITNKLIVNWTMIQSHFLKYNMLFIYDIAKKLDEILWQDENQGI